MVYIDDVLHALASALEPLGGTPQGGEVELEARIEVGPRLEDLFIAMLAEAEERVRRGQATSSESELAVRVAPCSWDGLQINQFLRYKTHVWRLTGILFPLYCENLAFRAYLEERGTAASAPAACC